MTAEYLFIGGAADGTWRHVDSGVQESEVVVPLGFKPMVDAVNFPKTAKVALRKERYVRTPLSQGENLPWIEVFVVKGETNPMKKLIEGYKPYLRAGPKK